MTVGDPKADEDMLKAASPARRAAEIKAPVLLIHGTEDEVVTPRQSALMIKALRAEKKSYEYVELKGEGHNGWSEANEKLVLERAVAFITRYI
jgi:dipeptidyl aminopeptidase/acylaminoacyl peptidase